MYTNNPHEKLPWSCRIFLPCCAPCFDWLLRIFFEFRRTNAGTDASRTAYPDFDLAESGANESNGNSDAEWNVVSAKIYGGAERDKHCGDMGEWRAIIGSAASLEHCIAGQLEFHGNDAGAGRRVLRAPGVYGLYPHSEQQHGL